MKTYLAAQGDTWDYLSYKIWGEERLMDALLKANPQLRRIVQFEEPTLISVPGKPQKRPGSLAQMPPWRQ